MPKTHKHLFPQVCAVDNVLAAARAAMQGKLGESSAARFHSRWETHAVQLAEELAAGIWQPGRYTYFDIHEPKLRRVAAAPFRDRVVHHALVRVLEPIFEKKFIEDSYALKQQRGVPRRQALEGKAFPSARPWRRMSRRHAVPGSGTSGVSRAADRKMRRSNRKRAGGGW